MIQPPFLKVGDTVAIIATARKINNNELIQAKQFLEDLGYKVFLGESIGLSHHQFAGTDIERTKDFQEALDNPNIKAIWCARGGYGTVRIIDHINFDTFLKHPKWVIGYSDITVLHSKINNSNIKSIHGPMAFDLGKCSTIVQENFQKLLKGEYSTLLFPSNSNNKLGTTKGSAIGGNLSVLYSLCGSSNALKTKGKILFIEDLDEYLYHIDRMMQNLKRNGYLKDLAGIVVGGMTHMHDNKISFGFSIEEIILNAVKEYHYPVVFAASFGHIKDNQPIILGNDYELNVNSEIVTLKPII